MRQDPKRPYACRHCIGFAAAVMIAWGIAIAGSDTTSPQAALRSLWSAVDGGDAEAIRQLLLVENDPQQKLAAEYAQLVLSAKRLGDVARQKFPGTSNAFAQGTLVPQDAAKIDSAEVLLDGQQATLKLKDRDTPIKLRRSDGGWKIVVDQPPDATAEHLDDQAAMVRAMADTMSQLAAEIAADKYPTVQEAQSAAKQRLGSVLAKSLQGELPASRPTTQTNQTADERR